MEVFDLHNDFLVEIKSDKLKNKYLESGKVLPAKVINGAVWTSKMDSVMAFNMIEKSYDFIESHNKSEKAKSWLNLTIEDLHFLSKINIDRLINAHPLCATLTWNNNNNLAGGALEGGDLTLFGLETIGILEQNHILIDTAHLSEKSFMNFAKITQKPILCSHSAVYNLTEHQRNLKDYQLNIIKESGGLLGICLVGNFLTKNKRAEINDVARHIDYVVSRFGKEYCAIGTDFYGTKNLPRSVSTYQGLSHISDRLKFMGYDQETIDDIFFNNANNFFKNNK